MKKITLTILLVLPLVGMSQDVTLNTQAQVNEFTHTSITGNLTIRGTTVNSITSLAGLRNLTSVGGSLFIFSNAVLSSLSGLDNLNNIEGLMTINDNDALSSLSALDGLTRLGRHLTIFYNDVLSSLSGLENITTLGGRLNIGTDLGRVTAGNPNLNNLCGVRQLITNGQINSSEYAVGNNAHNPTYDELRGDVSCSTYTGNITLNSQTAIDEFSTTIYTHIRGDLIIKESTANTITSLAGLRDLISVSGSLHIQNNNALTSLIGLENLTAMGKDLLIQSNSVLRSLSGLNGLTSVVGILWITRNFNLTSLSGLDNITAVGGDLSINSVSSLRSLDGLSGLNHVGGYLNISSNPVLTSLSGLNGITYVEETLTIASNTALSSLSGLENITTLGGSLNIGTNSFYHSLGNSKLTNLCGVRQLITNGQVRSGDYLVENNAYNPDYTQIQSSSTCSLAVADLSVSSFTVSNNNPTAGNTITLSAIILNSGGQSNSSTLTYYRSTDATITASDTNIGTDIVAILATNATGNETTTITVPTTAGTYYYGACVGAVSGETVTNNNCSTGSSVVVSIVYTGDLTLASQEQVDAFDYTNVTGNLSIIDATNNNITNLDALSSLNSVGGYLGIWDNARLTTLSGLDNLTSVGEDLYIGRTSNDRSFPNPLLTNFCAIRQLINNGQVTSVEYFVKYNAYNPLYIQIQDAISCSNGSTASVGDFIEKGESIIIYPNPAKDVLHIESEESITFVEIINTLGQVVLKTTESKDIHISFLPSGVYFVKVTDGLQATLVKILKD